MTINRWWDADPAEIYWLEITDRDDLGFDLNAPQRQRDGSEHWSYSLVKEVNEGDVVFHYYKPDQAVIARSVAGDVREAEVIWAAHGTSARSAGQQPVRQPGWRRSLSDFVPLDRPVTLDEIRSQEDTLWAIQDALEETYRGSLYLPFALSHRRPPRPSQGYLTKLPADIVALLDSLNAAAAVAGRDTQTRRTQHARAGAVTDGTLGAPYLFIDENVSIATPQPFEVDPESIERGNRGHRVTQNALAAFLIENGFEPRRRRPGEPYFDLGWEMDGSLFVAEVKSVTEFNEEKQLRLGLGQVLRYRNLLSGSDREVTAVLVSEREPADVTWMDLCRDLGVVLCWPAAFSRIVGAHESRG